jgi:hypothetical protein
LQEDDYWDLREQAEKDPEFLRKIMINRTEWFYPMAQNRVTGIGSLNILFFGGQRAGKSDCVLSLANYLDPTFSIDRISFRLSDLKRALDKAQPRELYVSDEMEQRRGKGSQWEIEKISTFLETKAKWGTSVFFATPTEKVEILIYGINYYVEIYGYNERLGIAMGLLYSRKKKLLGVVLFRKSPRKLRALYEAHKDQYLKGGRAIFDYEYYLDPIRKSAYYIQLTQLPDKFKTKGKILSAIMEQHPDMVISLQEMLAERLHTEIITGGLLGKHDSPITDLKSIIDADMDYLKIFEEVCQVSLVGLGEARQIDRWLLTRFHGKSYQQVKEILKEDVREQSIGKAVREFNNRITTNKLAEMHEQATMLYLNLHIATRLKQRAEVSQVDYLKAFPTDLFATRLQPSVGEWTQSSDVASLAESDDGSRLLIGVNCKCYQTQRSSWSLKCFPEYEQALHPFVLLVQLGKPSPLVHVYTPSVKGYAEVRAADQHATQTQLKQLSEKFEAGSLGNLWLRWENWLWLLEELLWRSIQNE